MKLIVISEEKFKMQKLMNEQEVPSDGNSSHDPSGGESKNKLSSEPLLSLPEFFFTYLSESQI